MFIANSDLPRRLKANADFSPARPQLFYGAGAGAEGYTDYPALQA
jgi:hypothetical protein